MPIAVVGAGTFAFELARAGHDVTVIVRTGSLRPQPLYRDQSNILKNWRHAEVRVADKLEQEATNSFPTSSACPSAFNELVHFSFLKLRFYEATNQTNYQFWGRRHGGLRQTIESGKVDVKFGGERALDFRLTAPAAHIRPLESTCSNLEFRVGGYNRAVIGRTSLCDQDHTWHDLRHTFISRLVMTSIDLRTVQELVVTNHSDDDTIRPLKTQFGWPQ